MSSRRPSWIAQASWRRSSATVHEPSAVDLARAALAAQRANVSRVGDAMDRARATGWLPSVRAGVRRGQQVDLSGLGLDAETNVSTDDDLIFDASLTFRFDRIVFASEEVGLLRELRAVEHRRSELVHLVVGLYFERRRLQLERDLLGGVQLVREIRILEIEALLDALTDGALTRSRD